MACVNPDGSLSKVAGSVLRAIADGASAAEVAKVVGVPLYRVRASLRELKQAGFLSEEEGTYALTESGTAQLSA